MKAIITDVNAKGGNLFVGYEIFTETTDAEHDKYLVDDLVNVGEKILVAVERNTVKVLADTSRATLEAIIQKHIAQVKAALPAVLAAKEAFVGLEVK